MLYYYGNDVSPKSLYMFKGEEEESSYVFEFIRVENG
jgi:hypothetical protein